MKIRDMMNHDTIRKGQPALLERLSSRSSGEAQQAISIRPCKQKPLQSARFSSGMLGSSELWTQIIDALAGGDAVMIGRILTDKCAEVQEDAG